MLRTKGRNISELFAHLLWNRLITLSQEETDQVQNVGRKHRQFPQSKSSSFPGYYVSFQDAKANSFIQFNIIFAWKDVNDLWKVSFSYTTLVLVPRFIGKQFPILLLPLFYPHEILICLIFWKTFWDASDWKTMKKLKMCSIDLTSNQKHSIKEELLRSYEGGW